MFGRGRGRSRLILRKKLQESSDSAYESISVSKKTKEQASDIDENNVTSNSVSKNNNGTREPVDNDGHNETLEPNDGANDILPGTEYVPSLIEAIEESINFIENKNKNSKSIFERPLKETHPMIWKVYQEEIKKPMDIKTIKEKRDKKLYKSFGSIDADITIMYQNCINYNSNPQHKNDFLLKTGRKCLDGWIQFRERFVQTDNLAQYDADLDEESSSSKIVYRKRKLSNEKCEEEKDSKKAKEAVVKIIEEGEFRNGELLLGKKTTIYLREIEN